MLNFPCAAASVAVNTARFITFDKQRNINLSFVENFSHRLELAIQRSGKSKGALAAYLKVPQPSVSRWLKGSEPRADRLNEIAKFLNVDVKWLLTGISPGDVGVSHGNAESAGKVKDLEVGTEEKIRHLTDEELFPHIAAEELAEFRQRLARLMEPVQKIIQEFPMAELLRHMEAAGAYPPFSPQDLELTFAQLWVKYAPASIQRPNSKA